MIYKQCVLTISNNTAILDEDVYLYRLDKNVELYFTIVNNKYKFDKSDLNNIINMTNASYFQMRLYKDEQVKYTFAIQPTDKGKAKLTITNDLIDEPIEVGDYDFQISLLDADKSSMVSMPIAKQQLHVCEPLVADASETGTAVLGLSQLDTTGEIVDAFDENGNYIRKVHVNGEIISAELFNKWETALETNTKNIAQVSTQYKDIAKQVENVGAPTQEQINVSVNSYLEKNPISFNQAWKNKKATFYGDSLTEINFQYTKGYHKWVQEILGLTSYENFGVSGYKISDVYNKVNSTTATGDIIFVMCGVNDENFSTPLGTMGDATTSTIYGSYDKLCSLLKSKYPTKIILFITPHYQTRYPHNDGITSYEVSKAMKEVCEKYAINVYDNYAISGIYPQNDTNKTTFTTDGCHWNDLEHEIVGKNLANYVLNTYRYVYTGSSSETTTYTVTNNLANSTSSNSNISINKGSSYNATITANTGYNISSIKVTMGGTDISSTAVSGNTITISNVTGNIIITVTTTSTSTTIKYTITNTLTNCTNSNTATSVDENTSYSAIITANTGYRLSTVTVTMGGTDITNTVVSNGVISIGNVIGDVIITAEAESSLNKLNITVDDFNLININKDNLSYTNNILSYSGNPTSTFGAIYLKELTPKLIKFSISNDNIKKNVWVVYKDDENNLEFISIANEYGKKWKMNKSGIDASAYSNISFLKQITADEIINCNIDSNNIKFTNHNNENIFEISNANTFGFVISSASTSAKTPICENLEFYGLDI